MHESFLFIFLHPRIKWEMCFQQPRNDEPTQKFVILLKLYAALTRAWGKNLCFLKVNTSPSTLSFSVRRRFEVISGAFVILIGSPAVRMSVSRGKGEKTSSNGVEWSYDLINSKVPWSVIKNSLENRRVIWVKRKFAPILGNNTTKNSANLPASP